MTFAKSERAQLCDLLLVVGPDAPTLCEGWTSHDLAAHLWIRESDPLGAPGIMAKPLASLTERRMNEAKARWSYEELVGRIASGPDRFSLFSLPGVDEPANATEYFVHHEDVRRAGSAPQPPRPLDTEVEDWMWRRMKLLGRAFFRSSPVGVVLERAEAAVESAPGVETGESARVAPGSETVTLIGRPSELLLYAFGRREQADVRSVGEPDAVSALAGRGRS
ncbi:MAG: TIGR03085 family metal-binding protein [Propionibacteriales bacterium]|nr:TIGR03085 family metal-binding protein [Propionibacteriales bacterium]